MGAKILSLAKFLELSPPDRLSFLDLIGREIDEQIARLKRGDPPIRDGRPLSYYLRLLRLRRQRLERLARQTGYGDLMDGQAKAG